MQHRRFEQLDADRQQRLFDSAAEEFGSKGYGAASLDRILAASGMSKSTLYDCFEDEADLFTTRVERLVDGRPGRARPWSNRGGGGNRTRDGG